MKFQDKCFLSQILISIEYNVNLDKNIPHKNHWNNNSSHKRKSNTKVIFVNIHKNKCNYSLRHTCFLGFNRAFHSLYSPLNASSRCLSFIVSCSKSILRFSFCSCSSSLMVASLMALSSSNCR